MMETRGLVWNQADKTQIPLARPIEEYLFVCRNEQSRGRDGSTSACGDHEPAERIWGNDLTDPRFTHFASLLSRVRAPRPWVLPS